MKVREALIEIGDEDVLVAVEYEIDPGQRGRWYGHQADSFQEIRPRLEVTNVRLPSGESAAREWAALSEQERAEVRDRLLIWAREEEEEEEAEERAYNED